MIKGWFSGRSTQDLPSFDEMDQKDALAGMVFTREVLDLYARADARDQLHWDVRGREIFFLALCSDTFHWASADAEKILPQDLALLRRCLDDLRPVDGSFYLSELFAARKRGMRPMRRWLETLSSNPTRSWWRRPREPLLELFMAAGPERSRESEG